MPILQVGSFWGLVEDCVCFSHKQVVFQLEVHFSSPDVRIKCHNGRAYSNTANLMQILITSQQLSCHFLAGDIQLPNTVVEAMQMQVNLCSGHSLCVFSVVERDPS